MLYRIFLDFWTAVRQSDAAIRAGRRVTEETASRPHRLLSVVSIVNGERPPSWKRLKRPQPVRMGCEKKFQSEDSVDSQGTEGGLVLAMFAVALG